MEWRGVITNAGSALLSRRGETDTLIITRAAAGAGRVSELLLMAQTALADERQPMSIVGREPAPDGLLITSQITAPEAGYAMGQYGIWAALNGADEALLAIFQNDADVNIPARADNSDFLATFNSLLTVSNVGSIQVTVDPSATVSRKAMEAYVAEATKDLISQSAMDDKLKTKADLGEDGKIPSDQLPPLDFVPTTRKVNNKALSADITLSASDVGAAASSHKHGAADINSGTLPVARGGTGAATAAAALTALGGVPTTRKVNNKPLEVDITLSATDVGARPRMPITWGDVDFNSLVKDGHYECVGVNANTPYGDTDGHFHVIVYQHQDHEEYVRQVAYDVRSNSIFTRLEYNGAWSDWGRIYTAHDKPGANDISGILPVSSGGTGTSTFTGYTGLIATLFGQPLPDLEWVCGFNRDFVSGGNITIDELAAKLAQRGLARIHVGSYVGTGTCGEKSPCTVTLPWQPTLLWVWRQGATAAIPAAPWIYGQGYGPSWYTVQEYTSGARLTYRSVSLAWSGNTVSWWTTYNPTYYHDAEEQLNVSGVTYIYLAIG